MDIDVKDPKFIRWALAILVVVAAVPMYFMSAGYPFTYAARKTEVAGLEARHQELSRDLEKARLLVRNLERVEQEYAILHEQWEVASTLLPEKNQMPDLLRKVTAAGQQSGIEFQIFRPQPAVGRGFYADNPIEVSIEGGYHQTGVFLSRVANLNRIINVSKLRVEGITDQTDQPYSMKTAMILTAYTQDASHTKASDAESADGGKKSGNKSNKNSAPVRKVRAGH